MDATQELQAVIEFQSDVTFPRFSMKRGERWSFAVSDKQSDLVHRINSGQRFKFAGGQCSAEDVLLVYVGPHGMDYIYAAGYLLPDVSSSEPGSVHLTAWPQQASHAICGAGSVEKRSGIDVSCAALQSIDVIVHVCPACLASYSASRPNSARVPVWLQNWRARQTPRAQPMRAQSATHDANVYEHQTRAEDLEAAGHRLALELECLLLDCKDLPTVSKWFESAHEALAQWQALTRQPHLSPLGMP